MKERLLIMAILVAMGAFISLGSGVGLCQEGTTEETTVEWSVQVLDVDLLDMAGGDGTVFFGILESDDIYANSIGVQVTISDDDADGIFEISFGSLEYPLGTGADLISPEPVTFNPEEDLLDLGLIFSLTSPEDPWTVIPYFRVGEDPVWQMLEPDPLEGTWTTDAEWIAAGVPFIVSVSGEDTATYENYDSFVEACAVEGYLDSDCDGVIDDLDLFPYSDLSDTVIIDGWDTGVANLIFGDGSTLSDHISSCGTDVVNHGQFVSCVSHVTNGIKREGIISGRDKGAIQRAAAHSDIGKNNGNDEDGGDGTTTEGASTGNGSQGKGKAKGKGKNK